MYSKEHNSFEAAEKLDSNNDFHKYRQRFEFPKLPEVDKCLYFTGHSLGLMPKQTRSYIQDELEAWGNWGVEGHFRAKYPWLPYHEFITPAFANLVGAKESEVVAMNTLTVNLHLMMVSFYRPTKTKFKILIENNTFPSDKYAVDSQARFHGFDPSESIVELKPREGEMTVSTEDIISQIEDLGDSLALVMLGNCNYLSGQKFDFEKITQAAHKQNAFCGFNLAHGAGNLHMKLHDWKVDFAVWCSYKYLNSGPGGIAGAFVHENHLDQKDIPRFEGWWGTNKKDRFKMGPNFDPIPTVEAWQHSNPPIFQLAALRSSIQLFEEAGIENLRNHGDRLTGYLEFLLKENCPEFIEVVTPEERGSMLSIKVKREAKALNEELTKRGVILDFREPDILRVSMAPLYNNFRDAYELVEIMKEFSND